MGKRMVILGAAESGVGAAVLAQKKGFDVFVSDMADNPKIMTKLKFRKNRHQIVFCLNDDFRLK